MQKGPWSRRDLEMRSTPMVRFASVAALAVILGLPVGMPARFATVVDAGVPSPASVDPGTPADDIADAPTVVTPMDPDLGFEAVVVGDTTGATLQADEPTVNAGLDTGSVWVRFSAPGTRAYRVSVTADTLGDATLAVYTGATPATLAEQASFSGPAWGHAEPELELAAIAGTEYLVRVAAAVSGVAADGTFTLAFSTTLDETAPWVTVTGPGDYVNSATPVVTLDFSEPVADLPRQSFSGLMGGEGGCLSADPVRTSATAWRIALYGCVEGPAYFTFFGTVADRSGNEGPSSVAGDHPLSFTVDFTAPMVWGVRVVPQVGAIVDGRMGLPTRIPLVVLWSAMDDRTGVRASVPYLSRNGSVYRSASADLDTFRWSTRVTPFGTYRYRINVADRAGNEGRAQSPLFTPQVFQDGDAGWVRKGFWVRITSTPWMWSGGSAWSTPDAGASLSRTFTGRSVAVVGARGLYRGHLRIYVDGVQVATVGGTAGQLQTGIILWQRTWSRSATHAIRIVAAGDGEANLDALVVLK